MALPGEDSPPMASHEKSEAFTGLSPAWQLQQRTSFEGPPENHHQTQSLWMVIPCNPLVW